MALAAAIGGLLALPASAGAEVLYDQTDNAAPPNADSEEPSFSPSNSFGIGNEDRTADDFTVPAGETWTIDEVQVGGAYSNPGAAQRVNTYIYADDGGEPGTELFAQTEISSSGPNYHVPLSGTPALSAGTYWITVQQEDAEIAYWSWQTRTVQTGNAAQWLGGAEGPGCNPEPWDRRSLCWPSPNPDQVFLLEGTKVAPPPDPPDATPKLNLGKLELNERRGTAKQPAYVNVPGMVELSGKNVETKSKSAGAAKTLRLKVKPRGKTLEKLEDQGHARTKITVTFAPDSGAVDEVKRLIMLRLSR